MKKYKYQMDGKIRLIDKEYGMNCLYDENVREDISYPEWFREVALQVREKVNEGYKANWFYASELIEEYLNEISSSVMADMMCSKPEEIVETPEAVEEVPEPVEETIQHQDPKFDFGVLQDRIRYHFSIKNYVKKDEVN